MWSIVVPVFNEEESLDELVRRVTAVANSAQESFELLLIDDGSSAPACCARSAV